MNTILPAEARWIIANRWNIAVLPHTAGGCHRWQGRLDRDGYGTTTAHGKPAAAHRIALTARLGTTIPDTMTVGHLCHEAALTRGTCTGGPTCPHRRCVNPHHLQLQTRTRNSTTVHRGPPEPPEP